MIDEKTEYTALRQEILNSINACDNYKIAMYTITVALLAIAFSGDNPILFLLPYVVLFAFQWEISKKNENNIVMGAYIAVYLEKESGWESDNLELKRVMHGEKKEGSKSNILSPFISRVIGRISSAQLGLLCSLLCTVYSGLRMLRAESLAEYGIPIICIVLSSVLYFAIWRQVRNVLSLGERKKKYIENLRGYNAPSA